MKKEYLLIFIIVSIASLGNLATFCQNYRPLLFDNQILLTWQYSALIGQLPYKDIFYPYGLLSYFMGHIAFFSFLYFIIVPLLFTFFYFIFQKVYKDRLFSGLWLIFLFLFIYRFTGFEMFTRYGIFAAFACLVGYLFYNCHPGHDLVDFGRAFRPGSLRKFTLKSLQSEVRMTVLLGTLSGIIFSLYNDQGIYCAALFVLFLFTNSLIRKRNKDLFYWFKNLCTQGIIYGFGFVIGVIPFTIYLLWTHSLIQFVQSFLQLSDLEQLAKTPFFHAFATPDIIFTLGILVITVSDLGNKFYQQTKPTLNTYLQIAVVFAVIIMEQKNIIRHIDNELSFVGILLLIFLLHDVKEFLKTKISRTAFFYIFLILSLIILFLLKFQPQTQSGNLQSCSTRFFIQNHEYADVKTDLEKTPGFNGKVFSFPADEIFYILFKQFPPYYPSAFEASSKSAQEKLIQYIQKNNIHYVIYNFKNTALQDTVPNYVRDPVLNKYLLNNFSIQKKVGDYLILQQNNNPEDFLGDPKLNSFFNFKKSLLNIDLEDIPRSEGIYKNRNLINSSKMLISGSLKNVNEYLEKNMTSSKNVFLSISFNPSHLDYMTSLTIKTKDGSKSILEFKTCSGNSPCIVDLANLPLFYRNRILSGINTNDTGISSISLVRVSDISNFW